MFVLPEKVCQELDWTGRTLGHRHYICKFNKEVVSRHLGFGLGISLEDFSAASRLERIAANNTQKYRTIFRGREVWYEIIDGYAITQGDIILGRASEIIPCERNAQCPEKRGLRVPPQYLWPGGRVPYTISASLPDPQRVIDAVNYWNTQLNGHIAITPRTNEEDYVEVVPSSSCSSTIGRSGGRQFINLATECTTMNIVHEFGHTLGLWHEPCRNDRDNYVTILYENIDPSAVDNFHKAGSLAIDTLQYDYSSIMHYSAYAFSINGQPTIETIPPGIPIGQRSGLSLIDIATVQLMYPKWSPSPDDDNSTTPLSSTPTEPPTSLPPFFSPYSSHYQPQPPHSLSPSATPTLYPPSVPSATPAKSTPLPSPSLSTPLLPPLTPQISPSLYYPPTVVPPLVAPLSPILSPSMSSLSPSNSQHFVSPSVTTSLPNMSPVISLEAPYIPISGTGSVPYAPSETTPSTEKPSISVSSSNNSQNKQLGIILGVGCSCLAVGTALILLIVFLKRKKRMQKLIAHARNATVVSNSASRDISMSFSQTPVMGNVSRETELRSLASVSPLEGLPSPQSQSPNSDVSVKEVLEKPYAPPDPTLHLEERSSQLQTSRPSTLTSLRPPSQSDPAFSKCPPPPPPQESKPKFLFSTTKSQNN